MEFSVVNVRVECQFVGGTYFMFCNLDTLMVNQFIEKEEGEGGDNK